jgi:hypothetical protein
MLLRAEIEPSQLARALQEQVDRYQQGRWVRLSDLLSRRSGAAPTPSSAGIADRLRLE